LATVGDRRGRSSRALLLAATWAITTPTTVLAHNGPEAHTDSSVIQVSYEETPRLVDTAEKDNTIASGFWPWAKDSKPAPEFQPYRLPTMEGDTRSYHESLPPLVKAPAINPDNVFNSVMDCYPSPSNFNIDVELRGQLRSEVGGDDLFETTDIGRNYVGIVARMPLYSYTELDRERDREYHRRTTAAAAVAKFVAAVATRNHAIRELALHRNLEARAAVRVARGIVGASEQVGYLEKVADGQQALIKAEAEIMESRLTMAALCDPEKQEVMSHYLRTVSAVPIRATVE
jgi:hypothetical protein